MLPYAYPATYSSTMHSGIYSPSYLIKDPWIEEGCGAVNYVTNDGKARDGAKKYHHGDFNSYFPTIPNWAGEWQFYGPKSSAGDQPPKVVMSKEEYLDDILRNAYKASKAKTKGQNATATALGPYQVHRSYLRSLKKKKLKSFMVRDLIDLPADERHLDASYANLQSMQLLTPPLEPEIAWKNYELSAYENVKPDRIDKSEPYSQYAPCSLTDSLDSSFDPLCDTVHSRLHCITEQDVTSSSDPSITCEPSARTATSPSSDSLEEHSESCSSEVSFCGKSKRIRTIFSCSQLERLEMEFKRSHYMVGAERSQLAAELNLSESQVKVWFQNRRIKHRKQQHEQQQTILSKLKTSQENDSQAEQENNSSTDRALSPSWCENADIYDRKSRKML